MKHLIDKIRAEVEKKDHGEQGYSSGDAECGYRDCASEILSFLDTLGVKEVDFERELSKYVSNGIHRFFPNVDDDYCKMESFIWQDYVIETAKYFFELGLKAQKGE